MHLLLVNQDFVYDPIYALGVVNSYDRFMANYRPESDKEGIFAALCQAVGSSADQYRRDANALRTASEQLKGTDALDQIVALAASQGTDIFSQTIHTVSRKAQFKYSRLFGIGLFTLLEGAVEQLATEEGRTAAVEKLSATLHLPADKLGKDLDSYRSNLTKLAQMEAAMADVLEASRKKREQREQEKTAKSTEQSA
jgi:photosystem II biogenesis protein Psp29